MYLKPGMSNPLPSTDKIATKRSDQTQDLTGVSIRHLAWILTDSSFIQESDLAMSSSGKMAADKHKSKYKPPSTVKQSQCTNSQRIHKRVHVQHIHETFPTKSWSFQDTTHIHVHVQYMHETFPIKSWSFQDTTQLHNASFSPPFKICFPSLPFAAQKDPEWS